MRKFIFPAIAAALFPVIASAETDYQAIITQHLDVVVDALRNGIPADVSLLQPNTAFEGYKLYDYPISYEDPYFLPFQYRKTITPDALYARLYCSRVGSTTAEVFTAPGEKSIEWQVEMSFAYAYRLDDILRNWPDGVVAAISCQLMLVGPTFDDPNIKNSEPVPALAAFNHVQILNAMGVNEVTTSEVRGHNVTAMANSIDKSDHIIQMLEIRTAKPGNMVGFETIILLKSTLN